MKRKPTSTRGVRKLYQDFRGRKPDKVGRVRIAPPKQVAVIGHIFALEYDTTRDGKTVKARHEFHPGSRPLFAVGTAKGQLYLIGTRYKFTARGIVDLDADGRAIE